MTGYLLAALAGVPIGYVLKCAVLVASEYLDRTPPRTPDVTPARPSAERASAGQSSPLERRFTAADVLGFYDRGARWTPPTFRPDLDVTERLAAWDRRNVDEHGKAIA